MVANTFSNRLKRMVASRVYRFLKYWALDVNFDMDRSIENYRKQGVRIGQSVAMWGVGVDPIYPELISIGDNVTITNTVILTHDDSPILFNRKRVVAPVTIGSNVFIGWDTLILPGVNIGSNCIIGAGSLVTRDIPSDSVAVGRPAKVIKSLEEHLAHISQHPALLNFEVESNNILEHEHQSMKQLVLEKYRSA